MATGAEWSTGYARQADADFKTFEAILVLSVPECHKLQFLQMACEKLVKAHLCGEGTDPADLQTSHACVAHNLPVVLRQQAIFLTLPPLKGVGFSVRRQPPGLPGLTLSP